VSFASKIFPMPHNNGCFVGIDIGGTKIAGALVTADGALVGGRTVIATPVGEGGPRILEAAITVVDGLIAEAEARSLDVRGIGIGAGGQIDSERGYVYSATDVLPGWKGLSIAPVVSARFDVPVVVDNDVNVLALGEAKFGAARHLGGGTVVFLALGTGVGGALVIAGKVHHGAHWSGGEFGHILLTMADDARFDSGGAQGTLEAYCSGPGMVQTYIELGGLESTAESGRLHGHDVVAAALSERETGLSDGPGCRAIIATGRALGFGLTTLANALDPDLIIIGGGLAELGDQLFVPAVKVLQSRAMPGPATCPVVPAALGLDAPIIGAASLVMV
jgi:glucokinase